MPQATNALPQDGPTPDAARVAEGPSVDDGVSADNVRFGVVLVLLLATFVFLASGPSGSWVPVVSTVLQGATLLAALRASRTEARWVRIAAIVVALSVLAAIVSLLDSSTDVATGFFVLNALLVAAAPVAIVRGVIRRRIVDVQTVLSAICIYVLIGMLWAFAYATMNGYSSQPFFAEITNASLADFLYFSFVTLTTVGYGDLTAAGGLGRAVAVLEALLGQLYLVTVVSLLVSNLSGSRLKKSSPS